MKKRQILWALMFGSMLMVTGCGDTTKGSCETICDYPCQIFQLVDSTSSTCLADCEDIGYDNCVTETRALVACVDRAQGGDCSVDPNIPCEAEGAAWSACP